MVMPRLAAAASGDSRGLHLDKDGKDRTVRKPRLEAKRLEKAVDFLFVEVDNQIVWPIAGALLVARRRAGHLVVIAMAP
jgi:hypothetical protein